MKWHESLALVLGLLAVICGYLLLTDLRLIPVIYDNPFFRASLWLLAGSAFLAVCSLWKIVQEKKERHDLIVSLRTQIRELTARMTYEEKNFQFRKEAYENVAHQLKTQLNAVLFEVPPDSAAEQELLEACAMTDTFLAVSSQHENNQGYFYRKTDLKEIVDQAVGTLAGMAAAKKIAVAAELDSVVLCADENRLTAAFMTLLENALIHSPEGKTISIMGNREGRWYHLILENEGTSAQKSWQRYASAVPGHYGIGLPMAEEIISHHFGHVQMKTEEGKTRITVTLFIHDLESAARSI